jgi:hypothetical protein
VHHEEEPVGTSSAPFTARPRYLASASPLEFGVPPAPGAERVPVVGSRPLPEGSERTRLRSLLAAVDAQLAAVELGPTPEELTALTLTAHALSELLRPYPDLYRDAEELRALAEKLPSASSAEAARARRRIGDLADLIRLQLAAAT